MKSKTKPCLYLCCLSGLLIVTALNIQAQDGYDKVKLADYYRKQNFDEAINFLKSYQSRYGESVSFNTDMGYALYMNEQYDEAKLFFQKSLLVQPENFEATLYLAQIWVIRSNPDSALFYYTALIRSNPENYRFWQKAGNLNYQLGNYDSAFNYYSNAYKLNNRSGRIAVSLVNLLIRNKRADAADSLLQEFLARDTADEDVIAKRIEISFRKSLYDTVIRWGEKLWRDSSQLITPFINLAFSYLNKQLYPECLQLCEWLEYGNKANESVLYCEALALAKTRRYYESNEKLDECLKMSIQEGAHTYLNAKADNFESLKNFKQATKYYDTAWYIFHAPYDLYFAGRIYDKYFRNTVKATYYYRLFQKNRPEPKNSGEQRVLEYTAEYLREKTERGQKL